jgi:hypothetical protein
MHIARSKGKSVKCSKKIIQRKVICELFKAQKFRIQEWNNVIYYFF